MKYYLKDTYGYIFAILATFAGIIISVLAIPFNIDSLYDEGYLYLEGIEEENNKA